MSQDKITVEREPASSKILSKMSALLSRLDELSKRTLSKLGPVMREEVPFPSSPETVKPIEAYPPLFTEMDSLLNSQIRNVEIIEDALSRTEL